MKSNKVLLLVIIPILFMSICLFMKSNTETSLAINVRKENIIDYEDIIIKKGNSKDKVIALTFDDGPDKDFTPQIIDILKKHNVKATFFVTGEKVGYYPEIVKRQFDEGHEIGNHTFTHINVSKRNYNEIYEEITKTQDIINEVTGKEPQIFRPPYRALSTDMCFIVQQKKMNIVLWSNLDPRDWSNPGVNSIVDTILTKAENGSIILLHDYNKVRNNKSQTIQAIDIVIPKLKEMGYEFVTVSELIDKIEDINAIQK